MFPDVTVFWVVFLLLLSGVILNRLIVRPVLRVMQQRESAVTSARELASSAAQRAQEATAKFDAETHAARSAIYREMDEKRRRALDRRAQILGQARAEAEASIREAAERVKAQAAAARNQLERDAHLLADDIVARVLGRKAF